MVVRASASQWIDRGFFPSRVTPKALKMVFTASLFGAHTKGIVWKTSWQACLLCPWARHLPGCLHLYMADKWRGQAIYPSWWPSLTIDSQTEHERSRSIYTSSCIMLRTNRSYDEEKDQLLRIFNFNLTSKF